MSQRLGKNYAVHGAFRERSETDWGPVPEGARYFVADLLEKRSGHVWQNGAHKVQITTKRPGAPRSRTFYGESAWSDAARYIDDFENWLRRQELDESREMSSW